MVLLAILLRMISGGGDSKVHASLDEPGGAEQHAARAAAPLSSLDGVASDQRSPSEAALDELEGEVRGAIAGALNDARRLTSGKVHGNNTVIAVHAAQIGGRRLISRFSEQALRPASSLKLVTAAAALVHLGVDGTYETRFEARGSIDGARSATPGVLRGDLVARAGADPLVRADGDGSIEAWLDDLAEQLQAAGIRRVEGTLVLDEGPFADPAPGPAWPSQDQHWAEYCALAGGFTAGGGCLQARVRATAVGAPARVSVEPRGHGLLPRLDVTTRAAKTRLNIAVEARRGAVTVRGDLPVDVSEWSARFAHPDPVALFGQAVVEGLSRRGLSVQGGWRRARGYAGGAVVARVLSPIADSLIPILRDSDNAIADQLFFATAVAVTGAGTRAAGRTATARALENLGVPSDGLVQVDGSGLSRDNRISARQLASLVEAVMRSGGEGARRFRACLPIAGQTGSLSGRMREGRARGRVFAKTGWIAGTSALAGLVAPETGETIVFAILVDYPDASGLNTRCWKPMQDRICEALVHWGEEQARRGSIVEAALAERSESDD